MRPAGGSGSALCLVVAFFGSVAGAVLPVGAEVGEPGFEIGEGFAAEPVDAAAPVVGRTGGGEEAGVEKNADVFADQGLAELEQTREPADGRGLLGEERDDQAPGGLVEHVERGQLRRELLLEGGAKVHHRPGI